MLKIFQARDVLAETLRGVAGLFWPAVHVDEAVPNEPPTENWLNVAIPQGRTQILEQVLGLGENAAPIRFAQIYHLEWVVRRNDRARREELFQGGMLAMQEALYADRTLGGLAKDLEIGAPDFAGHKFVLHQDTAAANIPVRVIMTGLSALS